MIHNPPSPRPHNVIALARQRGSMAQTRAGARRFLLRQCQMKKILSHGEKVLRLHQKAATYRADRRTARLRAHKEAVDSKPTYLAQLRAFRQLPVQVQHLLTPMYGGDVRTALMAVSDAS